MGKKIPFASFIVIWMRTKNNENLSGKKNIHTQSHIDQNHQLKIQIIFCYLFERFLIATLLYLIDRLYFENKYFQE